MRALTVNECVVVGGGITPPDEMDDPRKSITEFDAADTRPEGANAWGEQPSSTDPYQGSYWNDGTECRPTEQGLQTVFTIPGPAGWFLKGAAVLGAILGGN